MRIQISQSTYRDLASEYVELAKRSRFSAGALEGMVYRLAFEPYAPVRQQLLNLVRRMNKARRQQGLKDALCPKRAIRYRIDPISAFAPRRPLTPKGDEAGDGALAA